GAPLLYYQWLHGGIPIPGETNSSIFIPAVQRGYTGEYSIVVRNNGGTITAVLGTLLLDESPVILQSPQAVPVLIDHTVRLDVTASGAVPLQYQWRLNGVEISGLNASTLILPRASPSDAGLYDVVVANDQGRATSAVTRLTVVVDPAFDVRRD